MGKTSIEWTDASWNPIVGCSEVSPGCANCYAARLAASRLRSVKQYAGLTVIQDGDRGPASCPRHQHFADERIPLLLDTPAAVRFISAEPLLGPIDLNFIGPLGKTKSAIGCIPCNWKQTNATTQSGPHTCFENKPKLDWVICGGESGPNARPMHPEWARSLRDQCVAAGVPFFFKQWGAWVDPQQNVCALHDSGEHGYVADGREHSEGCPNAKQFVMKVGKKKAGRLLDGREWNEFPRVGEP